MNIQDFKSLFQKKYPRITKARKFWVTVVAVIIPLIVLTIIINLADSKGFAQQQNNQSSEHPKIQQLATQDDTNWYKKDTSQSLPDLPNKPLTVKEKTQLQNLMLGKGIDSGLTNSGEDETEKAMKAEISTNQITGNSQRNSSLDTNSQNTISPNNSHAMQSHSTDPNMQSEKKNFLNEAQQNNPDYLGAAVQNPVSPYELQAGSIIPATLITGINSDLPGQITAQVTENVYDSISGNNLLIPQGTKVVGLYDSKVAYGQERVLVAWKRLIFPNGKSLDLNGMPGVDISGYAGFNDEVNNHYTKIFGSVVLMSLLSAGAQLSQPQNNTNNLNAGPNVNQMLAQSLGTNIANTANTITQKNISIQPTLEIRPGYEFNISVTRDMVFQRE
jgi:type IV secretory pathway VirB10-like protein